MKKLVLCGALVGALAVVSVSAKSALADPGRPCGGECDGKQPPVPEGLRAGTPRPDAPAQGPREARVTVEVWSDFQCPFCARGAATLKALRARYGDRVRFVFRHLPLPFHDKARLAAEAAMAAHAQGRFWDYHDALFAHQDALDRAGLEARAAELGLDMVAFRRALDRGEWKHHVEDDALEARSRGLSGTPTFFVNGTPVVGAQPEGAFTSLIDEALKR